MNILPRNSDIGPITRKRRTFWDDPGIAKKLDAIPEGERGVIIRMALRSYFNIKPGVAQGQQSPDRLREIILEFTERSGMI